MRASGVSPSYTIGSAARPANCGDGEAAHIEHRPACSLPSSASRRRTCRSARRSGWSPCAWRTGRSRARARSISKAGAARRIRHRHGAVARAEGALAGAHLQRVGRLGRRQLSADRAAVAAALILVNVRHVGARLGPGLFLPCASTPLRRHPHLNLPRRALGQHARSPALLPCRSQVEYGFHGLDHVLRRSAAPGARGWRHRASARRRPKPWRAGRRGSRRPAIATCAQISEPTEHTGQASSTVTRRLVFLHRRDDGFEVERAQRAQVDHLGLDAFLGQLLGGLQRIDHAARERDDGDVAAGAGRCAPCRSARSILALGHRAGGCRRASRSPAPAPGWDRGWPISAGPWRRRGWTAPPPSGRARAHTRPSSTGCAGRRRGRPRRWGRGTRWSSPSARPTCRASWPPS